MPMKNILRFIVYTIIYSIVGCIWVIGIILAYVMKPVYKLLK